MIFEDDAELPDGFEAKLERILEGLPEKRDLVYLGFSAGAEATTRPFNDVFVIPVGQLNGTHAFMVSPEGARKILGECFPLTYQIDTELYRAFSRLDVFRLKTALVNVADFSSDIQNV